MTVFSPFSTGTRRGPAFRRYGAVLLVAASVVAPLSGKESDQPVQVSRVTAAFLYNFAKFTEWPADRLGAGETLSMCVVGDFPVADALEMTIKGRSVEGHPLAVQLLKADGPLRTCHLVFVGGSESKRSAEILQTLRGASVLSVGDAPSFAEIGGVAQLILENDRMRFAVNVSAAQTARLQMSSKLLSLATIVRDR